MNNYFYYFCNYVYTGLYYRIVQLSTAEYNIYKYWY